MTKKKSPTPFLNWTEKELIMHSRAVKLIKNSKVTITLKDLGSILAHKEELTKTALINKGRSFLSGHNRVKVGDYVRIAEHFNVALNYFTDDL